MLLDNQHKLPGEVTTLRIESSARRWARRILSTVTLLWVLIVALMVGGTLIPSIPVLGAIGTLATSFLTIHLILAALVGMLLALWIIRLGARRTGTGAAIIAGVSALGMLAPLVALIHAASVYDTRLSWGAHWSIVAPKTLRGADASLQFATIGKTGLSLDVYRPTNGAAGLSTPIVMMHGGGFTAGKKSDGKDWDRWWADRGYTVFDIEYRLTPQPTWKIAAQDVACAISWIAAHGAEYAIDPTRIVAAGQSAGAALALQVAYGDGTGPIVSSCGGDVPQVMAVLAFYPPDDMVRAWRDNPNIGPVGARSLAETYTGGTPAQWPDRYRAVSPIQQVRTKLPPTLVGYGEHDHLVPTSGHIELSRKLRDEGVPFSIVAIPFGDHGYDVVWGSLGGQITRHQVAQFLERYAPARGGGSAAKQ